MAKTHVLGFSVYLLNLIIIHAIVAIGLNILVGYTGQISLGHAGFFAIGAFTTVMFVGKLGARPLRGGPWPGGAAFSSRA